MNEQILKMSLISNITMLKTKIIGRYKDETNKLLKLPYSELEAIRDGLIKQYNIHLK